MYKIEIDKLPILLPKHIDQESVKQNIVYSPKTKMFVTYDEITQTGLICYEGSEYWTMVQPIKNKDFAKFIAQADHEQIQEIERYKENVEKNIPYLN